MRYISNFITCWCVLSRPAWTAPTSVLCSSPTSGYPTRAFTCVSVATALAQIVLPLKSLCSKVRCQNNNLKCLLQYYLLLLSGLLVSAMSNIIIHPKNRKRKKTISTCRKILNRLQEKTVFGASVCVFLQRTISPQWSASSHL